MSNNFIFMKKVEFVCCIILFLFSSCGSTNPAEKGFYKLSENQVYLFKDGGAVEAWTYDGGSKHAIKTCSCDGKWRMDDDCVIVEGLSNPNCPEMMRRNGKFKLDGEALIRQ
jgi:hypothetical protein